MSLTPPSLSDNAATISMMAGQGNQSSAWRMARMGPSSKAESARNAGFSTPRTPSATTLTPAASGSVQSDG